MRRVSVSGLALALVLSGGCQGDGTSPPSRAERSLLGAAAGWNLVLVTVDTLRADRLGAWGYTLPSTPPSTLPSTSPAIDELVGRGVRFENAHALRALTWPSLATVLTGLYPSGHGVAANGYELAEDQATLPLLLKDAGYRTAAFLSNMCHANHRGWDELACSGGVDAKTNRKALAWLAALHGEQVPPKETGSATPAATPSPFFLWVHYFGAHPPYYNGGERALELDPGYSGPLKPKSWALDRVMIDGIELAARDLEHLDALYDAAVIGTDRYVAELLAGLAEHADLERTVVVFLADHGEDLYQHHRYLYHACSVYQTALHVPLAIVAPGLLPGGTSVERHVELADVLPTLLELLGLQPPGCVDGRSMLPELRGQELRVQGFHQTAQQRTGASGPERQAFSEYGDTRIHTLVDGRFKLITNPDREAVACMKGLPVGFYPIGEVELYDLAADPLEKNDVAAQHPEVVSRLLAALEERKASRCHAVPESAGQSREIPAEVKEQLEALGYVVESEDAEADANEPDGAEPDGDEPDGGDPDAVEPDGGSA